MSLPLATLIVVLAAIVTNRILAVGVGVWFHVPALMLLCLLLLVDVIQIPFYYQLYEHGSTLLSQFPKVQHWLTRDWSKSRLGKWAAPLGGVGVMMVAAMPTFGGGMWSATFLAYGLGLRRQAGYGWMMLGSLLSYATLYWALDTLIRTVRYFFF